ncbi:Nucleolar protein 4-like [Taenia solium]|eukprot:TsM_001039500 transcript=TsM_001039500 gene=TsM_001039500
MTTKEDTKTETFFVEAMKRDSTTSSFIVLPKPPRRPDRGERSASALDLRTGTARKRSYSGGEDEANGASRKKIAKRKPTDQELALNFFIKQLALELLDRRLTIVQQPRHRLAQLEAACRRQFPAFNERQIRLKIRGQLKLYRRNLKKAEERKLTKPNTLSQLTSAFECPPLTSIDQNPSYLACNPNAVWMARRALANERKRGKPLIAPSTDALPLKPINDWQNVSTLAEPIVINRPSPAIRPNSCLASEIGTTEPTYSSAPLSIPPKRVQSNPPVSTSLPSPLASVASPTKPIQMNNSAVMPAPLKTLLEANKNIKPSEPTTNLTDFSLLNSSNAADNSIGQTPQSRQMNQTWPPSVSNTPTDASACIIGSCLRLAANFLLQSATFFESKNASLSDLNATLPPTLLQPPNLSLIMNPMFGSNLPPMPPLGTTNAPFSDVAFVCSTPTIISSHPPSSAAPSVGHPVTTTTT